MRWIRALALLVPMAVAGPVPAESAAALHALTAPPALAVQVWLDGAASQPSGDLSAWALLVAAVASAAYISRSRSD